MDTVDYEQSMKALVEEENEMIGFRLKELRQRERMTQQELAEQIGVTKLTISRWEREERCTNAEMLLALARALGTTASYLLGSEESSNFSPRSCEVLRSLRQHLGLRLDEVAHYLGLSKEKMEYIEHNEAQVSLSEKISLYKYYGLYMAHIEGDIDFLKRQKQSAIDLENLIKMLAAQDPDVVLVLREFLENSDKILDADKEFLAQLLKISLQSILNRIN